MPLVVPLLRVLLVGLNVYDTFKTMKPPPPSSRNGGRPSARAMTQRKRNMKGCLAVWIVWCCIFMYEKTLDGVVGVFVPFYDEIKSLVFLFLMLTRARGAEPIYLHIIRPLLKPYTPVVDSALSLSATLGDFVWLVVTLPFDPLVSWLRKNSAFLEENSYVEEYTNQSESVEGEDILRNLNQNPSSNPNSRRQAPPPQPQQQAQFQPQPQPQQQARNGAAYARPGTRPSQQVRFSEDTKTNGGAVAGARARHAALDHTRPEVAADRIRTTTKGNTYVVERTASAPARPQVWYPAPSSAGRARPPVKVEETEEEWRAYPAFPSAYPPTPIKPRNGGGLPSQSGQGEPGIQEEESERVVQQSDEEWRRYPQFPSAYPATPAAGSSNLPRVPTGMATVEEEGTASGTAASTPSTNAWNIPTSEQGFERSSGRDQMAVDPRPDGSAGDEAGLISGIQKNNENGERVHIRVEVPMEEEEMGGVQDRGFSVDLGDVSMMVDGEGEGEGEVGMDTFLDEEDSFDKTLRTPPSKRDRAGQQAAAAAEADKSMATVEAMLEDDDASRAEESLWQEEDSFNVTLRTPPALRNKVAAKGTTFLRPPAERVERSSSVASNATRSSTLSTADNGSEFRTRTNSVESTRSSGSGPVSATASDDSLTSVAGKKRRRPPTPGPKLANAFSEQTTQTVDGQDSRSTAVPFESSGEDLPPGVTLRRSTHRKPKINSSWSREVKHDQIPFPSSGEEDEGTGTVRATVKKRKTAASISSTPFKRPVNRRPVQPIHPGAYGVKARPLGASQSSRPAVPAPALKKPSTSENSNARVAQRFAPSVKLAKPSSGTATGIPSIANKTPTVRPLKDRMQKTTG